MININCVAKTVGEFLTADDCRNLGEYNKPFAQAALLGQRTRLIKNEVCILTSLFKEKGADQVADNINRLVQASTMKEISTKRAVFTESGFLIATCFHISSASMGVRVRVIAGLWKMAKIHIAKKYFEPSEVEMMELQMADIDLKEMIQGTKYEEKLMAAKNSIEVLTIAENHGVKAGIYSSTMLQSLVEELIEDGETELAFQCMIQIRKESALKTLIKYVASLNNFTLLERLKDMFISSDRKDQVDQVDHAIEALSATYSEQMDEID
ncbi:MAG: hypothetical protein SP4CHLAM5_11250 [Chlamydiia bacterium]|nr:hypothetical protein [Chlamydiia bacterium]MCH9618981.1 hypothetical protein [Chlamydiia bacterium]MCH9624275.1 hypothetical protein [Chlamydiia bacterium]